MSPANGKARSRREKPPPRISRGTDSLGLLDLILTSVSCTLHLFRETLASGQNLTSHKMARNSDFASYCNDLLHDPSDLMNFDNLSHDSPMEQLVYYDLQPVSVDIKE